MAQSKNKNLTHLLSHSFCRTPFQVQCSQVLCSSLPSLQYSGWLELQAPQRLDQPRVTSTLLWVVGHIHFLVTVGGGLHFVPSMIPCNVGFPIMAAYFMGVYFFKASKIERVSDLRKGSILLVNSDPQRITAFN